MPELLPPRPSRPITTPSGIQITVHPDWEVHPAQVKQCMDSKAEVLLLDVRLPREWQFNHIPGATHVPLNDLAAKSSADLAPWKKKPVVVYCHHGGRSMSAAAFLREQGFENVHSLAGGIDGWSLMIDGAVPRY